MPPCGRKERKNGKMKLVFNRQQLINSMSPLMCAAGLRGTNPITEYVNIKTTDNGSATFTTYDLEKGVRRDIECNVYEGGDFCVNAPKFMQTLKLMEGEDVTVEINDRLEAVITSGRSVYRMQALSGEDFPVLPNVQSGDSFEISSKKLKKMIQKINYAMGINDQRAVLNGAYFKIGGGQIMIVACDSYKLAKCVAEAEIKKTGASGDYYQYIMPQRTVSELLKLLPDGDDDTAVFSLSHRNMICSFDGLSFYTRLIDGEYIDFDRIIIRNHKINAVLDREKFIAALERASVVTEEKTSGASKTPITFELEGGTLKLYAASVTGKSYEEIEVDEHNGEDITISFNNRNLIESARSCRSDKIIIELSTPLFSVNIIPEKQEDGESDIFFIMPIRTRK